MKKSTSLSAGIVLRAVLLQDPAVSALCSTVFPIVSEVEATLPYIMFRRSALTTTPTKGGASSDTVEMEVACFTYDYDSGLALAEAVREALDGIQATHDGMVLRCCTLIGSEEVFDDDRDAFIQLLTFSIRV